MNIIPDSLIEKHFVATLERLQYGSMTLNTPGDKAYHFKAPNPGPACNRSRFQSHSDSQPRSGGALPR